MESPVTPVPTRNCPAPARKADFAHPFPKIRSIRNNKQYRQGTTERYAMNGFHFAHMVTRLAGRPRRVAISTTLVVLGLVVVGLAWLVGGPRHGGSSGQPKTVGATLADSLSWDRIRPAWPKYLPELHAPGQAATSKTPSGATVTPTAVHGPAEISAMPPSIAAGPELFAPPVPPPMAASPQPPPSSPDAPAQLLASRPTAIWPTPAREPAPDRLPVTEPVRSEAMEKIATQADQQIRHGFELADRGAYFAARAEFTAALRLIAQGLDNERNATVHSQALSAALTAIKEAQDFIPLGGKLEAELDLPPIVAGHRTPVLKNVPPQQLQAMRALKRYFTFAQEQLALAAGQEVAGSVALGALGKIHAALAGKPNPEIVVPEAKAIVFFQAAILVCPQNYMAANDLGVLLARGGDFGGARRMLEHSVLVCRCSANLSNLSVVYRQVGQQRLAELALEKAQAAKVAEVARQKGASLSAGGAVAWVDPAALVQPPGQWADPPVHAATAAAEQGPRSASPASTQPVSGMVPAPFAPTTTR
jgi:tetratricopeptide (TPR) repeat protein